METQPASKPISNGICTFWLCGVVTLVYKAIISPRTLISSASMYSFPMLHVG